MAGHIKNNPNLKTKRYLLTSVPAIGEAIIAAIPADLILFGNCARFRR